MSASPSTPNPALSGLQDIQLPADIGWWPLAPGWWALICIVLLLLIIGFVWLFLRWRKRRQQAAAAKTALAMLHQLDSNDPQLAVQISALLKRTAISYGERRQVAALADASWYQYLDKVLPSEQRGQFAQLLANRYRRPGSELDGEQLIKLTQMWLKHAPHYYQQLQLQHKQAPAADQNTATKEATC